jgi:Acetyltransferase (GNAT) domain
VHRLDAGSGDGTVRQAGERDVEGILDLLTHYDLPRAHFEPLYYEDPEYKPEQSWVVDIGRRPAAHLRVYDRLIRVAGMPLRIAGIGNVITARDQRGQGRAGTLLRGVVNALGRGPFAYSLLWTHVPKLYATYGWAPIAEEIVRGRTSPRAQSALRIRPFEESDLPEVMSLYEETNATRTGPTIRSHAYWEAHRKWTDEDPKGFLIARRPNGTLAGYVRSRQPSEMLELGLRLQDLYAGRALLAELADGREAVVEGPLPPSLRDIFGRDDQQVLEQQGLMGRTMNLEVLVRSLEPVWAERTPADHPVTFALETGQGCKSLIVSQYGVQMDDVPTSSRAITQKEFAKLLFHGAPDEKEGLSRDPSRVLFPGQDFVIWATDRF